MGLTGHFGLKKRQMKFNEIYTMLWLLTINKL